MEQALVQKTNELSEVEEATKKQLDEADENLKVKAAQIKNYKKQVDSLQVQLKEAQQTLALLENEESDVVKMRDSLCIAIQFNNEITGVCVRALSHTWSS